jgi:hypothetical protein
LFELFDFGFEVVVSSIVAVDEFHTAGPPIVVGAVLLLRRAVVARHQTMPVSIAGEG